MCGIVGYLGSRAALEVVLRGLKRLEYRGYDSAGVCVACACSSDSSSEKQTHELRVVKRKGKVSNLAQACEGKDLCSGICIGHTRWATHGAPSDVNSHPHLSANGRIAVVHNGIIENYRDIRARLEAKGCVCSAVLCVCDCTSL